MPNAHREYWSARRPRPRPNGASLAHWSATSVIVRRRRRGLVASLSHGEAPHGSYKALHVTDGR